MTQGLVTNSGVERTSQGDIYRNVEYVEQAFEKEGVIEISKIVFPLVVVLTQDCDLNQNARYIKDPPPTNDDKRLLSVLVAPIYNYEHFVMGNHLENLGLKMAEIRKGKTDDNRLKQNETPRYHYLEFSEDTPIVPSVVDFKHYFSVSAFCLDEIRKVSFVCHIAELYRENLSHRFANYLARIGLPDQDSGKGTPVTSLVA